MFKLESYVTPLILSYVDKYIKNLKPEDSQLSLWGGDAVFCNLDLRLDVLEQELQLPFTFVNGHIHELRIHVPWTKLGSEPVVITINTIECILKLHGENASADTSTQQPKICKNEYRRHSRKKEIVEAPPGYVQSLINRVISNISVVCNNLILKYVEDDIVLSLNIKSAELFSVNEKWERAFVDVNLHDIIIRKIASMQDLTVCLDKRDASGKIETYQDPLLYRCSTVWRIYSVYTSPHSKYPSVTHINMFCDRLDFSLTDQQLPMFVRLLKLCLALYYKEVEVPSERSVPEECNENRNSGNDQESGEADVSFQDESWGSWAWSFVPQMLPLWEEGLEGDYTKEEIDQQKLNKIFQFGIFIEKASCIFKLTEIMQDTLCYGTPKFTFSPLSVLHQYGCCMEMTLRGKDFVNVQLGVTGATISGLGDCLCGNKDFSDNSPKIEKTFLKAGIPPGSGHAYSYLSSSLFDHLAPENCGQHRVFCFDQEQHLSQLTEEVMVKRFPAFSFDYVYELEIPNEWTDKSSSITSTFLEESNWHETAVCRVVIGPFCADITSSMVHRLSKFIYCAEDHDYPSYSKANSGKQMQNHIEVAQEDIENLENFVPTRSYHLTLFKPVLHLSVADHPRYDSHSKLEPNKARKRNRKLEKFASRSKSYYQPLIFVEVSADCVDLQANVPMYPHRVNRIVSSLPSPSENLVYHCYSHHSLKLFGLEAALFGSQSNYHQGSTVIPQSSITFFRKSILFPEYWKEHLHNCLHEYWCECSHLTFQLTEPQVLSLLCIYQSWIAKDFNSSALIGSSLSKDILEQGRPQLCAEINGLEFRCLSTKSVASYKGTAMSAYIKLQSAEHSAVLFSAPECTRDVPSGLLFQKSPQKDHHDGSPGTVEPEIWFRAFLQIPEDLQSSEPLVLAIQMSGVTVCLDPAVLTWLSYETPRLWTESANFLICSPTTFQEIDDESSGSTQTAAASGSASLGKAPASLCSDAISFSDNVEQLLVDYYLTLKHIILQVEVKSCCVLFPVSPFFVDVEEKVSLVSSWKKAFNKRLLGAACMLCFPHIILHNSCPNLDQQLGVFSMDLPLNNIKGISKGQEHFPWTLSANDFSLYTIDVNQQQPDVFFVLNRSSASVTIAMSSKANQKQLGLCIHVDTKALNFGCSASQVNLMVSCLSTLLNCSKFFHFLKSWIKYFQQKPFHLNDNRHPSVGQPANNEMNTPSQQLQANENAEKIKIMSEEETTEKNYGCDTNSQPTRKVTLWIQLTLSKLTFNLFGSLANISSPDGFHFQFDTEEVTTSLDIQEVYSKMKIKLSSLNINCFLRWPGDSNWHPGPYEGIVLCSNSKLPPSLKTSSANNFSSSSSHSSAKVDNQPFLLATYTKALCTNAKKKWIGNFKHDVPPDDDVAKYISEIDIKVKPIDIILWLPLFKIIHETCHPLLNLTLLKSLQTQKPRSYSDEPKLTGFSNRNLPLLYVKTSSLRVFLPKSYFDSKDERGISGILQDSESCTMKEKPDMLLFQCGHVTLSSQVENPLSRIILHADLYSAAQSSKTIGLPGSDVEDRQYQLDVCGLSFGSVVGHDVVKRSKHKQEVPTSHPLIMGENPALEWNTGVVSETRKLWNPDPVPVIPIMSSFDLKIAVAPAIVCTHPSYHDSNKIFVVAGISSEISVAGDICLYLSIQQMHLLCSVLEKNLCVLSTSKPGSLSSHAYPLSSLKGTLSEVPRDSGIESETSTVLHSSVMTLNSHKLKSSVDDNSDITDDFVPFEILVTAGSIALMIFAHKEDLILDKCEVKSEPVRQHRSTKTKNKHERCPNNEKKCLSVNGNALAGKWSECVNSRKRRKRKTKKKVSHARPFFASSCGSSSKSKSDTYVDAATSASSCEKEDGYEGSSDSSESETNVTDFLKKDTGKLFPFLIISVSQPHSFIKCHPASQKFETSCFDLQFCGSSSFHFVSAAENYSTPLLSDFTKPYLETKPGDCDPKTGIPPALYTLTCTDFLHEPAKIKLRVERPVKCHLSPSMWSNINLFTKSFQFKMMDTALGASVSNTSASPDDISKDQDSVMSYLLRYLCHIGSLNFSTVQVVMEVDVPKPKNILVSLILDRFEVALTADSLFGDAEKVETCIKVFGAVLKTFAWGQSWPIIHPLTASVTAICQMKPWKQIKVIFSGEPFFINCGSRYFLSLQAFFDYFKEFMQSFGMMALETEAHSAYHKSSCSKTDKKQPKSNKKLYSSDDLRKGSFQFIQDSGRRNQQPEAYEIVFCKGFSGEPASMTWRYPEPRVLTKVDVSPVPFQSSVDKDPWNQFSPSNSYQVICHIQYWDSLRNEFVNLCDFELSETASCSVNLSNLDSDSTAVSEIWRALLDYEFEKGDCASFQDTEDTYLSPLALAACMCIDSCFDVDSIPLFQLMASFELLRFNFYNYFPETGCTPTLYPFTFDGIAPTSQEFMMLSADNTSVSYDKWASKCRIQSSFKISCDVLEYRCLTVLPLIDPFDVRINVVSHDTEKHPVIEADIALSPCFLKLSQSVVHTLHYSCHSWIKDLSPPDLNKYCVEYMLPNCYIVCNNTQEKIRFGQVNTDESIILASHKMHAYSWRTHKTQQMLRICLESSRWTWSQPFDIDSVGMRVIAVDNDTTLILIVKSISNLQKQIIIDGHLIIANRLNYPVHMKLSAACSTLHGQDTSTPLKTIKAIIPSKSCTASFVLSQKSHKGLCLSLTKTADSLTYSDDINITKSTSSQLIKIPWETKSQFQNVWCRVMRKVVYGNTRTTVVFLCPVFLIRNHLPRPLITNIDPFNQGQGYSMEVDGRGVEQQILVESNWENSVQLSFQMHSGMKISNPPLAIHAADVEKFCNKTHVENEDLEELYLEWKSSHYVSWPYSDFEMPAETITQRDTMYHCVSSLSTFPAVKSSEAPNTELKVQLSQRWNGFNTVLVDVKPWALFINRLDIELFLIECGGREWKLAPNSSFVPPTLGEHFKLGFQLDDELFTSIPLSLLQDNKVIPQTQKKGFIPVNGFIKVLIQVQMEKSEVLIFQLKSEVREEIRILVALPLIFIMNSSGMDLYSCLYVIPSLSNKVALQHKERGTVMIKNTSDVQSLLIWETSTSSQLQEINDDLVDLFFYMSLSVQEHSETGWSYPVCLSADLPDDVRHSLAVPTVLEGSSTVTIPCVLTSHRRHGLTFLTLSKDYCPMFHLHNQTNVFLFYGQSSPESEDCTVYEEKEKFLFLPFIPPGSSVHYTFPVVQDTFPVPCEVHPMLHLAWKSDDSEKHTPVWSTPINTALDNQFVLIPDACDVRISKERIGHTINLYIEPVNRIELSAKEIRSRIALATQPATSIGTVVSSTEDAARLGIGSSLSAVRSRSKVKAAAKNVQSDLTKTSGDSHSIPFALYLSLHSSHISIAICDELETVGHIMEVIRLSVDNALFFTRPQTESHPGVKASKKNLFHEVSMCFGHIQVDNQVDRNGKNVYDFPVVFQGHSDSKQNKKCVESGDTYLPNKIKDNALLLIELTLEVPLNGEKQLLLRKAYVILQPIALYLEDTLYYQLMDLYKSYIPVSFHKHKPSWKSMYLSKDVSAIASSLKHPLSFEHLKIDIKEVFLSVHASLKLYLSLERSLLRVPPFERTQLLTNSYQLGRIIVFHYLTGALLRAGWVVGSLDLLGNPAGFARAVGMGVMDFVLLPYRGLLNGPRAFITGLSHGAAALFTQVSSGALTCVTNLAASVSRNMDLLSLDADHLARQELLRRNLPHGVAGGLLQGLSVFGISILGAIAGIVDHPLQVLVSPSTPVSTATGIVSGFGKGLVGVFTKPIGGAAELVSQTGFGLLHGAGWLSVPARQHEPLNTTYAERLSSALKFACKLVPSGALGEILLCLPASHVNENGQYEGNILILTSEVLSVVSTDEDNQQRTFALTEVKCQKSDSDHSTLLIIPENMTDTETLQESAQSKARVVEYVQRSCFYENLEHFRSEGHSEETTVGHSAKSRSGFSHAFFVQPKYRNLFFTTFHSAKRKVMGKGFLV